MLSKPTPQEEIAAKRRGDIATARVVVNTDRMMRVEKPSRDMKLFEVAASDALREATDEGYSAIMFSSVTEFIVRGPGGLRGTAGLMYRYVWEFAALSPDQ